MVMIILENPLVLIFFPFFSLQTSSLSLGVFVAYLNLHLTTCLVPVLIVLLFCLVIFFIYDSLFMSIMIQVHCPSFLLLFFLQIIQVILICQHMRCYFPLLLSYSFLSALS